MLLISDSVLTEYRINIYDHLDTSGDQKMLSGDISHIQHSGLQAHPVTCGTEETHQQKFNNKHPLNLIFFFFPYLIPGLWIFYNSTIGSNKTWLSTGQDSHSMASENTDSLFTENLNNIFLAARYPNNFQSPQLTVSVWNCSHYMM